MDNRNVVWTNDSALVTCMLIKIVIIILCVYPIIQYGFYSDSNTDLPPETANASDIIDSNSSAVVNKNHTTPNRRFTVVKQPTCSNKFAKELEMQEILYELHVKNEMCTPEDINNLEKHRIPKLPPKRNETSNPRGTIVVYFAVGLLLTSLGAACLEFFKAKGQLPAKSKTPLTRKCSLADLTVLRHTRKELVRRESVMEGVDHPGSLRASGRKVSRLPLRLE